MASLAYLMMQSRAKIPGQARGSPLGARAMITRAPVRSFSRERETIRRGYVRANGAREREARPKVRHWRADFHAVRHYENREDNGFHDLVPFLSANYLTRHDKPGHSL